MTDTDLMGLVACVEPFLETARAENEFRRLVTHITQLRSAVSVILECDPGIERKAAVDHLASLIGVSNDKTTIPH